jgi:hypothetical protein
MTNATSDILIGSTPLRSERKPPAGDYVELLGETYYRIAHYDQMPPFLMSLVSSADHWLFIASTGGLTAGRIHADLALFPYETEDKLMAHAEQTGGKTILRVTDAGRTYLWEPFSDRYAGLYRLERRLYKNVYGNKLIFEEVNHDLQLRLRTGWFTGDRFGFIRGCWLQNMSNHSCQMELLDGLQNLLPYGATNALQTSFSSLMNAYKRSELDPTTGLGMFALSATLSDRAEPSESLKATVAWQIGLDASSYLLSSDQLDAFRTGQALEPEQDVRGKAGAYLVNASLKLGPEQSHHWRIVGDVSQDSAAIAGLNRLLQSDRETLLQALDEDIDQGTAALVGYVAAADGLQLAAQETTTAHHFANVLFNIMRGGIFAAGYQIERDDFIAFVRVRNRPLLAACAGWFDELPERLPIQELYARAAASGIPDLVRLSYEYLPLTFSRRHGDPSRPWNAFAINLKHPDGSRRLDYQGNWRDIFQNWEPLSYAFPAYVEGMIAKFLNATTADGYNPYRVTRDGIEWEIPAPENPWANIGYWSDHQIIYLQKLLEIAEQVHPGTLGSLWNQAVFAYADVPYRLRPYAQMLADWNNTIDFDWDGERASEQAVAEMGTDGRLVRDKAGAVRHVMLAEKLLVLLLAKLTNLVPEGGIWMNTQRPEWNDANNALVGKGLSVVTVAYLRRFIAFWQEQLAAESGPLLVNTAVAALLAEVGATFGAYQEQLASGFSDRTRRAMMDELGQAATAYRETVYQSGIPDTTAELPPAALDAFLTLAQAFIEQTLSANLRPDGLTHSYNVLRLGEQEASVENLYLMLEGQVALLSSGLLAPEQALALLQSLRRSDLYRADQNSYMLYPNRDLPGFMQKNHVPADRVAGSQLIAALASADDRRLLVRDVTGAYHFNGGFHNAWDVARTLDELSAEPAYAGLVTSDRAFVLDLFERTFNHRAFTGRSGTFFAYEGLGSIYWHMVSKLLLAVQECQQQAVNAGASPAITGALAQAYYDIRDGLGFNKSPSVYGAFPTDPYSHTPLGGGARQPGMTGQVKEEILTRMGELGVSVRKGQLCFRPTLLRGEEFLAAAHTFAYVDVGGQQREISLPARSLAFTVCQTPVVYLRGDGPQVKVKYADGRTLTLEDDCLDAETSRHIFERDGQVQALQVNVTLAPHAHHGRADR